MNDREPEVATIDEIWSLRKRILDLLIPDANLVKVGEIKKILKEMGKLLEKVDVPDSHKRALEDIRNQNTRNLKGSGSDNKQRFKNSLLAEIVVYQSELDPYNML